MTAQTVEMASGDPSGPYFEVPRSRGFPGGRRDSVPPSRRSRALRRAGAEGGAVRQATAGTPAKPRRTAGATATRMPPKRPIRPATGGFDAAPAPGGAARQSGSLAILARDGRWTGCCDSAGRTVDQQRRWSAADAMVRLGAAAAAQAAASMAAGAAPAAPDAAPGGKTLRQFRQAPDEPGRAVERRCHGGTDGGRRRHDRECRQSATVKQRRPRIDLVSMRTDFRPEPWATRELRPPAGRGALRPLPSPVGRGRRARCGRSWPSSVKPSRRRAGGAAGGEDPRGGDTGRAAVVPAGIGARRGSRVDASRGERQAAGRHERRRQVNAGDAFGGKVAARPLLQQARFRRSRCRQLLRPAGRPGRPRCICGPAVPR